MPRAAPDPPAPPTLAVHLALLTVQAAFSGLHVFGKVVLESVPPLALASIRVLFAAPTLLLLAYWRERVIPRWTDLPRLALLGLFGVFLNQVLFISGLRLTTATNAAILMPAIPVFAVGLGAALGLERTSGRRLSGILLAVSGTLVILDPTRFSLSRGGSLGDLLVLLNCVSYAAFLVLQRPLLERLGWRTVLAWAFLLGGAGVVSVGGGELAALSPAAVPPAARWGLVYILLFPTLLAYTLNTWAVRRSSAVTAAAYTTLQPLLTALAAVPLLGEPLGWRQLLGFALIAAGLWRAGRRRAV
ncbi:MAG: DMT family transporter [Thermoanaerobaculia bacterium]|nr:DMT family transporter [Thermoanaerobaculia bacterium]